MISILAVLPQHEDLICYYSAPRKIGFLVFPNKALTKSLNFVQFVTSNIFRTYEVKESQNSKKSV